MGMLCAERRDEYLRKKRFERRRGEFESVERSKRENATEERTKTRSPPDDPSFFEPFLSREMDLEGPQAAGSFLVEGRSRCRDEGASLVVLEGMGVRFCVEHHVLVLRSEGDSRGVVARWRREEVMDVGRDDGGGGRRKGEGTRARFRSTMGLSKVVGVILRERRRRLIRSCHESCLLLVLSDAFLSFLKLIVGDLVEPLLHQERIARDGE